MNYNKVMLAGNITKDAELLYTPKGVQYVTLRLAVNRRFRNKANEVKEETLYITVVAWDSLAESCKKLTKGFPIFVEGILQQKEYEKNGEKHTIFDVRADVIKFLKYVDNKPTTAEISTPELAPATTTEAISTITEEKLNESA
jgi:single-strand DNA-binding protein